MRKNKAKTAKPKPVKVKGLTIGQAIKYCREADQLTQAALASASGLSLSAIASIEQGARIPTVGTLHAIASALGLSLVDFIGGPTPEMLESTLDRRYAG